MKPDYRDVLLLIDGQWTSGADGRALSVRNPAIDAYVQPRFVTLADL